MAPKELHFLLRHKCVGLCLALLIEVALSPPAGKGWVPPEVREQVRALLQELPCKCYSTKNVGVQCNRCAALDALEEK